MKKFSITLLFSGLARLPLALSGLLFITFTAFSQSPAPSFGGGTGSASFPYLITTLSDLAELSSLVNSPSTNSIFADKHYKLAADLDLSGHANWSPIGLGLIRSDESEANSLHSLTFRGVFDGDGHKIANLSIKQSPTRSPASFYGHGLFGVVDGGTVKNLVLGGVVVDVASVPVTGGLVGAVVNGGVIANVDVSGSISGAGSVGGIVGHVDYGSSVISSSFSGSVSGSFRVGGIAGHVYSNGVISDCHVTGSINSIGSVGDIAGSIWNSVVTDSRFYDPDDSFNLSSPESAVSGSDDSVVSFGSVVAGAFSVGPNPVSKSSDAGLAFFWRGRAVTGGKLSIYNSTGKFIKKIKIPVSIPVDLPANHQIGSWDLTDAKGRLVSEGSYLVKGVINTSVKRDKVSVVVGVR